MKEESADNIISGSNHTLGLAVLGRGVRARKTVGDAVVREKGA